MACYSRHSFSQDNQAWRFQIFREKITNAIVSRVQQVIKFIQYGISGKAALTEALNIITRLKKTAKAILTKKGIQIIPL
jgi:hypothetical protein